VLDEARSFLSLPRTVPPSDCNRRRPPAPVGSTESARRLFAMSQPIAGTIAESYLCSRGITALQDAPALRFHPRCYYRPDVDAPAEVWPALIAAVTDLAGSVTGVHRTWLDPTGEDKAPIDTPRRAMGHLLGHGVRFGVVTDVMAAGEGIETMLSVRSALPDLSMVAALSANHLAALLVRVTLRRLYLVRDDDPAGDFAVATLTERAQAAGVEVLSNGGRQQFSAAPHPAS
jgi:Toprim domain